MTGFTDWYAGRHGYPPFPWQAALAARIAGGDWPEALTPPTGSGKTGVIDAWLWARLHGHPVPRRLVYVIDRRLVVDGVVDYAESLARSLPESDRPAVIQMRGGVTIENDWVRDPARPAIIVSTVDQAGSRLLFSGYGISAKSAPIHAALLGNDALWVLDEVHLAQPLLQTLATVAGMRGGPIDLPFRALPMSATWDSGNTHGLGPDDFTHPVLARRLDHPKPARLVSIKAEADLVKTLAREASALRDGGAAVVAVVCNRVATARSTFEWLRAEGDAVLLTGRIRPADKAPLLAEYLPRMETGSRSQGREPLFVVATQTIEVGADLDFDAMVTECAPLSALRQRAGRLNRLGELPSAPMTIVYQPSKNERVYGNTEVMDKGQPKPKGAVERSWHWLTGVAKRKVVDFGINAMDRTIAANPPRPEAAPPAPLLLSSQLDLLASNIPHGIGIAPWLHGWERGAPDVYLCWRADASVEGLKAAPPQKHELLAVPLWAVRQWSDDVADVEIEASENGRARPLTVLRWDGEEAEAISLAQARIGDTLILPCSVGGSDRYGWAPHSKEPVTDVGDSDRRVRLHPAVHPELASQIAALIDTQAPAAAWQRLAKQAGLAKPGRVIAIPEGCVVLSRGEWTSASAYRSVFLRDHGHAVAAEVVSLAQSLGLADPDLLDALRRAGAGHDAGKADPRWQAMVGGDQDNVLAKGPGGDNPWLPLPPGWRHEMGSVAQLAAAPPLVRYLVGTHHGNGRPLFPAAPGIELWRQMGDWAGLRGELAERWGHWGLALLETLVRLADWRVSENEQKEPGDETDRAAA
jgi:CRISPR-associated endonuclease/helicase Cas3